MVFFYSGIKGEKNIFNKKNYFFDDFFKNALLIFNITLEDNILRKIQLIFLK